MNTNNLNNLFPTSESSTVSYTGYTADQEQAYTQFTGPNMASTSSFPAPGYPLYFPGYDASGNIDMSVAGPVNDLTPVYLGHLGYVPSEVPTGFFTAPTAQPADLYSNYPMTDPANMDIFNVAHATPFNPLGYSPYPDPAGSPVYESDPWDTSESTFFTASDSDPQAEAEYLEAPYVPTRDDVIWYCGGASAETADPIAWEAYQSGRSLVDVQFNPAEHQISRYSEFIAALPWRMGEFYEGPVSVTPAPTPTPTEDVVMGEGEVEGSVVASGADASAGASGSGSGSAMRTRSGVKGAAQKIDRKGKKTPRMIREAEMAAAAAAAKESVKADSRKGKKTERTVKAEIVATAMDVSSASPSSSRSRGLPSRQSTASTARLSRSGRSPEKSPRKGRAVGAEFGDQEYEQDVLREVESIEPKATRSGRRFVGGVVEEEKERSPAKSPRKARGVRAEFGNEEFEVDMLREAEGIEPKVTRSGRRRCVNVKDEEADVDEVVAMLTVV
ncbi:hypothetical protein D9611_014327 [Ephemerocybe angulata]|uniref:Uncharacterized protein n=1 Tax=Ephemerocybe angulata TaxID=980116 RepID=A0A8H5FEW1_9AGAR|nr:hypothetical protein D9611_014327 [Tulosesus angulatus]